VVDAELFPIRLEAGVAPPAWGDWQQQDDHGYLYRHATQPRLFAIAARAHGSEADRRDLMVIPDALTAFLHHIDRAGLETAAVSLLAAGRRRPWPALFPFVMMLKAIHKLAGTPLTRLRELVISIVDPAVWNPLIAGKVPVELLLSADAATVWVHVVGEPDDELETYAISVTGVATVDEVARRCGLPPGRWTVSVYPVPGPDAHLVASRGDVAVVPGASVTFTAATDEGDAFVLAD